MKKIFLSIVIFAMLFSVLPVAIHADETTDVETTIEDVTTAEPVEEVTTETITEEPIIEDATADTHTEPTETPTEGDEVSVVSFIDRIIEAWENGDINLVVSLAFDVAIIVFAYLAKKASKKNTVEVASIFGENGAYTLKQNKTVEAINLLVDAANDATKAVESEKEIVNAFKDTIMGVVNELKEIDLEKLENYGTQLESTRACIKLLAEMLQTTYANSTTISQPTKNIINQKYVDICNMLKVESGDKNA